MERELAYLKSELNACPWETLAGYRYCRSALGDKNVYLAVTGVGVVSTAVAITALASTQGADRIIMTGSAGSFPGSGLAVGDVVVASSEAFAELGVCSGAGTGNADSLEWAGVQQCVPLSEPLARALTHASTSGDPLGFGPFLTVAGVSNDPDVSARRAQHFGALVESMEGYVLALAGQRLGIEVGELRGVSNIAGIRDKSSWDLDLANTRAQDAVLAYLRSVS